MPNIIKGLIWAAAIILVALVGHAGWIERDVVTTLVLVLPVLAVMTLRGGTRCGPVAGER